LSEELVAKQKHRQAELECTRDDKKHELRYVHLEIPVARTFQQLGYGAGANAALGPRVAIRGTSRIRGHSGNNMWFPL
jgi:hypothetical protein